MKLVIIISILFLIYSVKNCCDLFGGLNASEPYKLLVNDNRINLINYPLQLCSKKSPFLFVYVISQVNNFKTRQMIRNTWAKFPKITVGFIVGISENKSVNAMIDEESSLYSDIIQGNFIESSRNSSFKSIIAWKWIISHCSYFTYYAKVNEDVIVNPFHLNVFLSNTLLMNYENSLFCSLKTDIKVERDLNSEFYVSRAEFSADVYNAYCSGSAYIMTNEIPRKLYSTFHRVPFFWIDEIFMGIMANFLKLNFYSIDEYFTFAHRKNAFTNEYFFLFIKEVTNLSDFNSTWSIILKKIPKNTAFNNE